MFCVLHIKKSSLYNCTAHLQNLLSTFQYLLILQSISHWHWPTLHKYQTSQFDIGLANIWVNFTNTPCLVNPLAKLTYFGAKLISFSCKPINASTSHCSQWKAVIYFADCICNTWLKQCAWVPAFSTVVLNDAGFLAGAISVHLTTFINDRLWNYIKIYCITLYKLIKIQNGFVYYYILGVQATP